ncbi:MAG: hypothetical protein CME65_12200 [Halobacteriovoraceae bacterium]|nr:hypothetical protein [Halobacteriovoraceae bacterium]|tara:strand:+ start:1928 stop:3307 length:1380 start_codon:yes stop_codon:yes gene_type:complete
MKLLTLLVLLSLKSFAFVDPLDVDSSLTSLEAELEFETRGVKNISDKRDQDYPLKTLIFQDKENKINNEFEVSEYFKSRVSFWFDIYTQYDSNTILIHDLEDLNLVYSVLDYGDLFESSLHRFTKAKLQSVLTKEYRKRVRDALIRLSKGKYKALDSFENEILKKVIKAKGKLPKGWKARNRFFRGLAKSVRGQTGQKDFIYAGLLRFHPYENFLYEQIENFKLPKEVLAISFLESSFNPNAMSKVSASGVWQFMPFIGNLFMPKASKKVDYRESPIISTLAAMHLLKQNKQILKRWDLAVTAYNSGTKHLIRAKRRFKNAQNFDLAYVLENYESKHLGFASKNFYSEFLALVHVLAYKNSIYGLSGLEKEPIKDINIYVGKCYFGKKSRKVLFDLHPMNRELNLHINDEKHVFKKGLILASAKELPAIHYFKLSNQQLKKFYPKNYYRYIKNEDCGKL